MFRIMAAVLPSIGTFGLKTLTGYPGRRLPGETYFAVLLFTAHHGALRAIVAANHLTGIRTGAATGVAARYLARANATRLGIIGAGVQARYQVAGIFAVRPVRRVKVFDIDRGAAEVFARQISEEFDTDVSVANSARDAVASTDIVVTVTTSREWVFRAEWLEEGMHLTAVGANSPAKRELDPESFRRSKVVVDFKDQVLAEAGDLLEALNTGVITPEHVHAELGEIVTGRKPGRTDNQEITLFKSVGVALEDVATAAFVYEQALAKGVGTHLALNGLPSAELVPRLG